MKYFKTYISKQLLYSSENKHSLFAHNAGQCPHNSGQNHHNAVKECLFLGVLIFGTIWYLQRH
jgi:hypothetical protein